MRSIKPLKSEFTKATVIKPKTSVITNITREKVPYFFHRSSFVAFRQNANWKANVNGTTNPPTIRCNIPVRLTDWPPSSNGKKRVQATPNKPIITKLARTIPLVHPFFKLM